MNPTKLLFLCLFFGLIAHAAVAQDTLVLPDSLKNPNSLKKRTAFTISISYLPKLHFYGRTDNLKSTALAPGALIQFGNGIYLSSAVILLNNKQASMQYAATVAGAGYIFGKEKGFAGSVFGDLFFYANKDHVQSSQKGQVGYNLSYLNPVLNINNNSSIVFSGNNKFW